MKIPLKTTIPLYGHSPIVDLNTFEQSSPTIDFSNENNVRPNQLNLVVSTNGQGVRQLTTSRPVCLKINALGPYGPSGH